MRKSTPFLVLFLLLCFVAEAQKTISGTLKSASGDQAVAYANIALLRQSDSTLLHGVVSDDRGRFTLPGDTLPTLLRISAIGFETRYLPITDTAALALNLGVIELAVGATTLDAVSITATRPIYSFDGEKNIYNVREDPSIQGGTAQDALINAPGVSVDGEGNITLNGKPITLYINDHKSLLEGETLKQYIKTLTADQISTIEVMEFPTAKYGATGPVINIHTHMKLLRNSYLSFGANGSTEPGLSPFLSYTYANEKLHLDAYLRYMRYHDESHSESSATMLDSIGNLASQSSSVSDQENINNDLSFSLYASYEFDTMNNLSFDLSLNPFMYSSENDAQSICTDYIHGLPTDFSHTSHYESSNNYLNGFASIGFNHLFNNEGHMISFSLNGNFSYDNSSESRWVHYATQTHLNFDERAESSSPSNSLNFSTTYSYPYSEDGELGASLSFYYNPSNSIYLRDTLEADGLFHPDYLRSDTNYSPSHDLSLSLSWRRKWGNFTLITHADLSQQSSTNNHSGFPELDTMVHSLLFHPILTLLYRTQSMHSFSFSYWPSYVLPSAEDLSRYVSYGTESFSSGNPNLEISHAHNFSLGYNKYFEQGHSISAYGNYSLRYNESKVISNPVWSDFFGRVVPYTMPYNAGDSRLGQISVSASYRVSASLSFSLNGGVKDSWYNIMVRPDRWVEDENFSGWGSLNVRAKLFNLFWVTLSSRYNSGGHGWSALSENDPSWTANAYISADLFDRKLSFYLNIYDIFNTNTYGYTNVNPYFTTSTTTDPNTQYITFGLSLRFGKMELGDDSKEGIQEK